MSDIEFDYPKASQSVVNALREEFPHDTIATTKGYKGRVHVKIVSETFNGMNGEDRQAFVYDLLRAKLGEESQPVTLVQAWGTEDL
ncbi:hypothetical protein EON81_10390 [bacterium]|nr:MAG: hypothetical protein EON81_10390 [bacterium]